MDDSGIGVDGFRIDAARHFPRWVLNYFDQATFLAKQTPLLDGSIKPRLFMLSKRRRG